MLTEDLRELLLDVRIGAGASFSGIGLLVSHSPAVLPIVPLRPASRFVAKRSVREALIAISDTSSEFHDGFHILSPAFELVSVSQYFSPPIVIGVSGDPARRLGGRYMAALFGSTLPDILAAGVASSDYGIAVFQHGHEIGVTNDAWR